MTLDEYAKRYKLRIPATKAYACRFLESRGLRFLIEFGIENAVDKAAELLCEETEKQNI